MCCITNYKTIYDICRNCIANDVCYCTYGLLQEVNMLLPSNANYRIK